jgi:AcrR family transcriptional regulator
LATVADGFAPAKNRPERRRRSDGERSRDAILRESARLATVEGLGGLSIGRLADAVGMSKSGLFAHFGSKEELQLATVEAAAEIFIEDVVAPTAAAEATGVERLRLLALGFLRHVESGVFPGGCFFASVAMELEALPRPVHQRAVEIVTEWFGMLVAAAAEARDAGEVDASEEPGQLAFEIDAFMLLANAQYAVSQDPLPLERARIAIDRRLALAATVRK